MTATIVLTPQRAAETVCHDEQMVIWASDFLGMLNLGGWLREDMTYDDGVEAGEAIKRELRSIIEAAFDHPEARTMKSSAARCACPRPTTGRPCGCPKITSAAPPNGRRAQTCGFPRLRRSAQSVASETCNSFADAGPLKSKKARRISPAGQVVLRHQPRARLRIGQAPGYPAGMTGFS